MMKEYKVLENEIKVAREKNISWDSIESQLFNKLGASKKLREYCNISEPGELGKVIDMMKEREMNANEGL